MADRVDEVWVFSSFIDLVAIFCFSSARPNGQTCVVFVYLKKNMFGDC